MCGVFGYVGRQTRAAEIVFQGIKELEYRGYDSWGEAFWEEGKTEQLTVYKQVGKIEQSPPFTPSCLALGHTRWATHGKVTVDNSHPHLDCTGRLALVHNGIIENFDLLKSDLVQKGHRFVSETDSEVAAHLLEEELKHFSDFGQAFAATFAKLSGLNALVVLDTQTHKLYAAKIGSPLVIGLGREESLIASDANALLPHTRRVVYLEDGQGAILSREETVFLNLKTQEKVSPLIFELSPTNVSTQPGNFPHLMLKEIFEQPHIIRQIPQNSASEVKSLAQLIRQAFGTYLVGCGTAAHACLFGQYLLAKVAQRHVNFAYGSEFGFLTNFLTPRSLVLAISQSGETIDIIEAVNKAKEKGAKIGALVNVLGSTLYRKADFRLLLGAGPEKAVAATKSFTAKLALLVMLAYELADDLAKGQKELAETSVEIERILADTTPYQKLAQMLEAKEHLYLVGRGLSYPLALEAALKIKEISYIHAEGYAAGELKHGVIALIEGGTPCVVLAPEDEAYGAVMSGAMELKARGAYVIGVAAKNRPEVFDYHLAVKDTGVSTAITQAVVGQLLAYYLAKERGCEIDKPRNLAKSVTVK
ncbi:MAG: glutamine--fructose-6-phosphate transaminase (isomerizing) [bacterium]|nr:glutamine--fructose-6-phosphate transaminase (isomerizing) [bacterium]